MSDICIGIHLGLSNSYACVYMDGKPIFIPSTDGSNMQDYSFPSYVAFTSNGCVLVGEAAKRRYVSFPDQVVMGVKKDLGKHIKREFNGNSYSPQQISAYILGKIKKDAETFLNQKIYDAIITVPAYFDDNQRTATKDAAKIAGLNASLINEPVAACLAYGINNNFKTQNVLVFDLSAGTLNITILKFDDGIFEIKATSGDTQIGGTDMNNILTDFLAKEFERQHGVKLQLNNKTRNRLFEVAERVKIDLTSVYETEVNLPFMGIDSNGNSLDLITTITRAQLDDLVRPIVNRCEYPIQTALDDAGLSKSDIDKLILVGGPTKMPIVRKFVQNFMGINAEGRIDSISCVAQGAAIYGAKNIDLDNYEIELIDNKEILKDQIKELEEIIYHSKKYIYEPEFQEKLNNLDLDEIKELISILKQDIIS